MKRFIILFIFFISFGFLSSQTLMHLHQDMARDIASTPDKDCNNLMKKFLSVRRKPIGNRITTILTEPVTSVRRGLSYITYKYRMGYLRVTGLFSRNTYKRSERFAYLANAALEDNLIEADDLKALAKKYETSKRVNLYYDETLQKLVLEKGDGAVTNEDATKFFRRFKITDSNVKNNFRTHSVTEGELKILQDPSLGVNELNLKDALTYIQVCRSYSKSTQINCLAQINKIFTQSESNQFVRRYIKVKKKSDSFYRREQTKILKEMRIDDPTLKAENLPKKILDELDTKTFLNKSLRLSCQSSMKNTARRNARGRLLQMIIVGEAVSAGIIYHFDNRHKEKDKEWVAKLGENLSYHFISGYIHSVLTSSAAGFPAKVAGVWLEEAIKDSYAAYTYSTHLNPNQEKVREEVQRFLSNPDFLKELEELLSVVDNDRIYYKVDQEIKRYLNAGEEPLSTEQKEESIDQLTDVLSHLAYKEISNGFIETGDIGLDYYSFNRGFDVLYSIESMALTLATYNMLCRAPEGFKRNAVIIGGTTLYIINKLGVDQLYNQARMWSLDF